jgi:hypothetical protein
MVSKKLITRIKGGLGNQLFCYASARRLALVNQAELIIDDISGFAYDSFYRRKYALDAFQIPVNKATYLERMEPIGRFRRKLLRFLSKDQPLHRQRYILQEGVEFDSNLLSLHLTNKVTYFDGFGQSESYFSDIEEVLRRDLVFKPPQDNFNQSIAKIIKSCESVAVHVRWFSGLKNDESQASDEYYRNALKKIQTNLIDPHLFIFSDQPKETAERFGSLTTGMKVTYVVHNQGDEMAYADLWLMSLCRHFIIANSTFSWWGAWLGEQKHISLICAPKLIVQPENNVTAWGFKNLLPDRWTLL